MDKIALNQTTGDPKVMTRMERNVVIVVVHILLKMPSVWEGMFQV